MTRNEYRRRLGSKKVGIAGAGGLGSNCAVALARAGIGCLVIADFDRVSRDNLDRQAFFLDQEGMFKAEALAQNIARIDPGVRVEAHVLRLDAESLPKLFSDCDAVVEAFDAARAKLMFIETLLAALPGRPLVCASGLAGFGHSESFRVRRSGALALVGDFESEVGPDNPPMAPRVGIVAAMEADLVLEALLA
ncbi:MAG: sulfur carrier protein ThiS adenylyltransferase ThiF [Rectinemataceae bacterium]